MKPRSPRPTRRQRRRMALDIAQLFALKEVAAGRREPAAPREEFYRRLREAGCNPDPRDFILPWPLAQLEITVAEFETDDGVDAAAEPS